MTKSGLRERKKQRTRQSIVDVASRLFAEQGYQHTTLAQIASEADVATSTFFNYFGTKVDIVFSFLDVVIESAQERIAERPDGEPAEKAITSWLRDVLPGVEQPYAEAIRRFPAIVAAAPELRGDERLRIARLEDVLAAGFARDLGEPADAVRPRVLAAMALHGMIEAWTAWFAEHAGDTEFRVEDGIEAKAVRVAELLEQGRAFIDLLPGVSEGGRARALPHGDSVRQA